jgi:hypothetical protein
MARRKDRVRVEKAQAAVTRSRAELGGASTGDRVEPVKAPAGVIVTIPGRMPTPEERVRATLGRTGARPT